MNEPTAVLSTRCPACWEVVERNRMVCPHCGQRLKPGNDFLIHSFAWLAVLLVFALVQFAITLFDTDGMFVFLYTTLLGLPLVVAFGTAVLLRIKGTWLTWHGLKHTALRATAARFVLLAVLPIVIGAAVLLFAFSTCADIVMPRL